MLCSVAVICRTAILTKSIYDVKFVLCFFIDQIKKNELILKWYLFQKVFGEMDKVEYDLDTSGGVMEVCNSFFFVFLFTFLHLSYTYKLLTRLGTI